MSKPVRVMHFADTHFGVELYGRIDAETGMNSRLLDFKRSLLEAVDMALAAGIQMAVFAGDAYKTRNPHQTDQREFADCIRRLTTQHIPVVMIAGNHDMPAQRGRANAVEIYRTLGVTNVHVMTKPGTIVIETSGGPVRVCTLPYLIKGYSVQREEFQGKTLDETRLLFETKYAEQLRGLSLDVTEANDDIPTILLGHFWAHGAKLSTWQEGYLGHTGEPQVSLSSLTDPAFDYVALGHIHKFQDLNKGSQPPVVYSGSPDRIDFGERDETKGFVIVDLEKGNSRYQFIPLDSGRALLDIRVDADCDEPTERIVSELKRQPLRNNIVKLTYSISHTRLPLVREREIRDALDAAFLTVSISRKVERDSALRSRLLTESIGPREALELYIDSNEKLLPRRDNLLASAEPLFAELAVEDA